MKKELTKSSEGGLSKLKDNSPTIGVAEYMHNARSKEAFLGYCLALNKEPTQEAAEDYWMRQEDLLPEWVEDRS